MENSFLSCQILSPLETLPAPYLNFFLQNLSNNENAALPNLYMDSSQLFSTYFLSFFDCP